MNSGQVIQDTTGTEGLTTNLKTWCIRLFHKGQATFPHINGGLDVCFSTNGAAGRFTIYADGYDLIEAVVAPARLHCATAFLNLQRRLDSLHDRGLILKESVAFRLPGPGPWMAAIIHPGLAVLPEHEIELISFFASAVGRICVEQMGIAKTK